MPQKPALFQREDHDVMVIRPDSAHKLVNFFELIRYRDLLFFLVWRDVKTLYSQTVLGIGWSVIRPAVSALIFTVVFGTLARVPSDGVSYPVFAFAGLLPWTYFSTAMTASATSLINSSSVLNKVYFPRIIIPLTPVLAGLVDFSIGFLILGLLLIAFGISPSIDVLYTPLLLLIMIVTSFGMGLWLSALAIQYRDIKHVVGFLTQLLMYVAPVVWPVSLIRERFPLHATEARLLYGLFPMAGVIEGFRSAWIGTAHMPWDLLGVGTISATLLLLTGLAYFRSRERFFSDVA